MNEIVKFLNNGWLMIPVSVERKRLEKWFLIEKHQMSIFEQISTYK